MKRSELKSIIKECIQEVNGEIISEASMSSAELAIHAASGFAKIEKNKSAMAALMDMRDNATDPAYEKKFFLAIKKILNRNEYEAIKSMM